MNVLKMAWRNVWRNSRRSAITIAAMTLALFVELLYSGLVTGLVYGMEDDVTELDSGDMQIFATGYLTRPSLYDTIADPEAIVAKLEEAGYRATARLFSGGLAASGDFSAGVSFVGLNPERDTKVLALDTAIGEGKWLDDADPKGVVVGRGLARTLSVGPGSEIVVLSQAADGSLANDLFTVRGVLMSVAAGLDRTAILMPEQTFRELMALPEGAHKIIVRKPREVPLDQAAVAVKGLLGVPLDDAATTAGEPPSADGAILADAAVTPAAADGQAASPIQVRTWKELNPFIATWMDSVSAVIVVFYLIIYVAVAILILNAMLMAVFERIQEFGVLKAIGYGPWQVLSMMLLEGLLQAVVATVLGVVLALFPMWYLSVYGINVGVLGGIQMVGMTMPPVWMGHYTIATAQVPVIMLFVIVFFAVLYPAAKAAWIRPVEAMHHQ